jgi:hypothetical protein
VWTVEGQPAQHRSGSGDVRAKKGRPGQKLHNKVTLYKSENIDLGSPVGGGTSTWVLRVLGTHRYSELDWLWPEPHQYCSH